jgi:glycosyltransferase 2 family protein
MQTSLEVSRNPTTGPPADGPQVPAMGPRRRRIGWACVVLALSLGIAALFWFADEAARALGLLRAMDASIVAVALGLTLLSLAIRMLRWTHILGRFGHRVPSGPGARIYVAGLALSSTPGKVGETSRSLLLLPHGVPVPHSLAAFVCDRLADVIAVALIGALAGALVGKGQPLLAVIAGIGAGGGWWVASRWRAGAWLGGRTGWVPGWLRDPAAAFGRAWRVRDAALWVAAAALAYGAQALGFALFVEQVHPGLSPLTCVAIFASATLIGAASMVPGGLGAMDAALAWQLHAAGVPLDAAIAATLAARACTLWFVWLLSLLALLSFGGGRALR